MELRNPFIFAPIKTGYGTGDGLVTERHIRYFTRRALHVGAVTPEPFYLARALRELPTQMGIDADDKLPGLRKLVDAIHAAGAKVVAHLNHPGRMANPKIPGNRFVSSTDRACENGGASPSRLDDAGIRDAIALFVDGAARAEAAGFDIIELQFGHGYLAAQFLSPLVNDRDDGYGGALANRARFALETLDAVKARSALPIIIRVSGDEMVPGGLSLDETKAFASMLAEHGATAVHVSAGTVCSTPPWYFQHMFVPKGKTWEMARAIRASVEIPVVAVGRVSSREDVNKLLDDELVDYIAVGRALVADPDFIGKVLGEIDLPIVPCLACAEGCLGGVKSGGGLGCLVNPSVGREDVTLSPASGIGRVAVVGGGLAGMEAALTLAERGVEATIYERDELGGQFRYAPMTPHKKSMGALIPSYIARLDRAGISVVHSEATARDLTDGFDAVIVATGAEPKVPPIEGLTDYQWAEILLQENLPKDEHVLIIGGGLIGVDVATALIPRGNRVTIVKRTEDFGEDMEAIAKKLSLAIMKKSGVTFSDHTTIQKIDGRSVRAIRDNEEVVFEDVDRIVVSAGMKPYAPLVDELEGALPVYVIGDAKNVGDAQDAIRDAWDTARSIGA